MAARIRVLSGMAVLPGAEPGANVVTGQYSRAGTAVFRVLVSLVFSSTLLLPARRVTSSSTRTSVRPTSYLLGTPLARSRSSLRDILTVIAYLHSLTTVRS